MAYQATEGEFKDGCRATVLNTEKSLIFYINFTDFIYNFIRLTPGKLNKCYINFFDKFILV